MPGNLEALLILHEHAYGVKQKTLIPQRFSAWPTQPAATKPVSRAPKAARRTLDAGAPTPPDPADNGPRRRPAGALHPAEIQHATD
jgi:hypothetical protein